MNERETVEYLEEWYLTVPGNKEVSCRVKNHNEALDTAIAALNEVQEYHATGRPDTEHGKGIANRLYQSQKAAG